MTKAFHLSGPIILPVATGLQLKSVSARRRVFLRFFADSAWLCILSVVSAAGVGGSISGTVKDSSGAAIVGASVSLSNSSTGAHFSMSTDDRGGYNFPVLPVGTYTLEASRDGFNRYRRTAISLSTNGAISIDITLHVGQRGDKVTVSDSAVHLETYSSQVGEVIDSKQMTAVPLNGRSYTDLLSLQAGVAPDNPPAADTGARKGARRCFGRSYRSAPRIAPDHLLGPLDGL